MGTAELCCGAVVNDFLAGKSEYALAHKA